MTGAVIPFPQRRDRDLLEIARSGEHWIVTIFSPGQTPMVLAQADTRQQAEQFCEHVAGLRGSTGIIWRRQG